MSKIDDMRLRAEKVLGWKEGASNCFSLPTLAEWVRKDPKLYREMTGTVERGEHLFIPVLRAAS